MTAPTRWYDTERVKAKAIIDQVRHDLAPGPARRAVNDRPYEWMTIGCPEFDGDSHTRKANWFGMTVLFGAHAHLYKSQFLCPKKERAGGGKSSARKKAVRKLPPTAADGFTRV